MNGVFGQEKKKMPDDSPNGGLIQTGQADNYL